MDRLVREGLGLDYGVVRLERTTTGWLSAASQLRSEVKSLLAGAVEDVELIGSSSVLGLLAKPIVDLAVGMSERFEVVDRRHPLELVGWVYRGDSGDEGGHVFVLDAQPSRRVAHIYVVSHGQAQWVNYLLLRDLRRASAHACERYEAVKVRLTTEFGNDRRAYTDGKSEVVRSLLDEANAQPETRH